MTDSKGAARRRRSKPGAGKASRDSLRMLRQQLPDEAACRRFLEEALWPDGRICPHCGGLRSWPLRGKSARPGLYECAECHRQFTVTTKTPLHATKLPLTVWIEAFWLMLWSSKGLSSVVLGRWLGLPQKTAWKIMHACRELMHRHQQMAKALTGVVEIDDKYVGGAPRYQKNVKHKRGHGTNKPQVVIAANREGFVRASHVVGDSAKHVGPFMHRYIDENADIMSDGASVYRKLGEHYRSHQSVNHGKKEFVRGEVHNNTSESFGAYLERVFIGVYHRLSRKHLHRYLSEAGFRWNAKQEICGEEGDPLGLYERIPPLSQVRILFGHAQGCELRSTLRGGIRSPDEPEPGPKKWSARLAWARRQGPEVLEQVLAERTPASLF
ncbi:IS1595 family transposase [Pelagibius marinus]|uniref:IS1595 family transposase n=1 Tax=Pelagibius marinus TaxID=2762760 RepID=UPI001D057380|nr:IS1595 family transposase [Pelagibius marinus]